MLQFTRKDVPDAVPQLALFWSFAMHSASSLIRRDGFSCNNKWLSISLFRFSFTAQVAAARRHSSIHPVVEEVDFQQQAAVEVHYRQLLVLQEGVDPAAVPAV